MYRGQLARLDDALTRTARQGVRTPPGTRQIAVGNALRVLGVVGLVVGFVPFALFGEGVRRAGLRKGI